MKRQLFEKAYDRLESEFEVVLKNSQEDVKKMDKAFRKRRKTTRNAKKKTPFP